MQAEDKDRDKGHHRLPILIRHGGQVEEDHLRDRVRHHRQGIPVKHGNSHHRPDHQDQETVAEVEEEVTGDRPLTQMMMIATISAATPTGKATDLQNYMNSLASDQTKPAKLVTTIGSRNYI